MGRWKRWERARHEAAKRCMYANNPAHTHGTMRRARGFVSAVRSVIVDNVKRGCAPLRGFATCVFPVSQS